MAPNAAINIGSMDFCTPSQFLCSLKYPDSRLHTLHNVVCDPETFLCDKHIAMVEGCIDYAAYHFYVPITYKGASMILEAVECASKSNFCDMRILKDEILYSGLNTSSCSLYMESIPDGIKLSEAIYSHSTSKLLKGLREFKSRLRHLDISHNNLSLNTIVIDIDNKWHSIYNYNLTAGFGGDKRSFAAIERSINEISYTYTQTAQSVENQRLHSITTDNDGNTIYPIVESCRRFTSKRGVGFKDRYDNVIIPDDYLWASDFSSNRAVVQLKSNKMGIIDRKGRYIIEPLYSSIIYNPTDGISIVHDGELQTRFDYLGEQLEEWHR